MGDKGLGPKEIELTKVYRVEECIDGKPLTMLELRNPDVARHLMEIICETNYDQELREIVERRKGIDANHTKEFINGWFRLYMDKVRPRLKESKAFRENHRANEIFETFEKLL